MIDTITIRITPNKDIVSLLGDVEERCNMTNRNPYFVGTLDNLRVRIYPQGTIISGSLSKYYTGSNLANTTRCDVEFAVSRLADALNVPVASASVYRFDIGATFDMDLPVGAYLGVCGTASRYERIPYRCGVEYRNGRRSMVLYDKLQEMKQRGELIPEALKGLSKLRYELQYKNRVKDQFNGPVTMGMLFDERFYACARERWLDEYLGINKRRIIAEPNTKNIRDALALRELHRRGEDEVLAMLKASRASGQLTDRQYYRQRDYVIHLASREDLTVESAAASELTGKVVRLATGPL